MKNAQVASKTGAEGSTPQANFTLNMGGKLLTLDTPKVMGILNITANSFYDGGNYNNTETALKQCEKMLNEGATIIDVGANSTKPGAEMLSPEKEQEILLPIFKRLKEAFKDTFFSIDTFNSSTAKYAVDLGAHMINDVSAGNLDSKMFQTIAALKVPYVAMHMQGNPLTMQQNPIYKNVSQEILFNLSQKVAELHAFGLNDIILDPGFGFGKTLEHNYTLLNQLDRFHILQKPLLVGVSRKGMIYKLLKASSNEALNGTTVVQTMALLKGVHILRVHDVKEAMEVIKIVHYTQNLR